MAAFVLWRKRNTILNRMDDRVELLNVSDMNKKQRSIMDGSRRRTAHPSGKSKVAIGFLKKSGEAIASRVAIGSEGPISSWGRSIRHSVKNIDE